MLRPLSDYGHRWGRAGGGSSSPSSLLSAVWAAAAVSCRGDGGAAGHGSQQGVCGRGSARLQPHHVHPPLPPAALHRHGALRLRAGPAAAAAPLLFVSLHCGALPSRAEWAHRAEKLQAAGRMAAQHPTEQGCPREPRWASPPLSLPSRSLAAMLLRVQHRAGPPPLPPTPLPPPSSRFANAVPVLLQHRLLPSMGPAVQ